jgi:exodeoxyribonuclease VII large subunit
MTGRFVREPSTVTQVNQQIKALIGSDPFLNHVYVTGEISKITDRNTLYFTIKDDTSVLNCIMWPSAAKKMPYRLEVGMKVILRGYMDVYVKGGSYSLIVEQAVPEGTGEIYIRLKKLEEKLREEGLFDEKYKRPIPKFAAKIGIVTSPTGQAVLDIVTTAKKRNPYVEIFLAPAVVQGERAAASIAEGISRLDALNPDVIIVGRGGGSSEDLWAFNEEEVAWAIFNSQTPVISAVGHTGDVSIADSVADMHVITPTEAAVAAVTELSEFDGLLAGYMDSLSNRMRDVTAEKKTQLSMRRLKLQTLSPQHLADSFRKRLAAYPEKLYSSMKAVSVRDRSRTETMRGELRYRMQAELSGARTRIKQSAGTLQGLSPLRVLAGGYAYVEKDKTKGGAERISGVHQLEKGDALKLYFHDGRADAVIRGTDDTVFAQEQRKS